MSDTTTSSKRDPIESEVEDESQTGEIFKTLSTEEHGVHCIVCAGLIGTGVRVIEQEDGSYCHDGRCPDFRG